MEHELQQGTKAYSSDVTVIRVISLKQNIYSAVHKVRIILDSSIILCWFQLTRLILA